MNKKVCNKCKTNKSLEEFHKHAGHPDGLCNDCKKCCIKRTRDWVKKNYKKVQVYKKKYGKANRKKLSKQHKYYLRQRRKVDVQFRLRETLRHRLNMAVNGNFKSGSAVKDLGCSIKFFKKHLEKKFTKGMKWWNYGKWHIDHIKPLRKFDLTKRKELLKACNYKNLQPLWAKDNLKKGKKVNADAKEKSMQTMPKANKEKDKK